MVGFKLVNPGDVNNKNVIPCKYVVVLGVFL